MGGELIFRTLKEIWARLEERGLDAAVMGGLALSRWRRRRNTDDIDLLVAISPDQTDDLIRALDAAGFSPRRYPPVVQIEDHRFVQLCYTPPGRYELIAVDLLFADGDFLRSALDRAVVTREEGEEFAPRVVRCEDLIILKLQADRIIDRIDVVALLQYNRETLDFAHLTHWVDILQLRDIWSQWWSEAFPDEPAP